MKISEASLEKCKDAAARAHSYIARINDEWKKVSMAAGLWPHDYVKEDRSRSWLGAVLPAFLAYYFEQKGCSEDELAVAAHAFSLCVAFLFGDTEEEREDMLSKIDDFRSYFNRAHKIGERSLDVISLPSFLEKKRGVSEEKIFACTLLYVYTLGAYWAMNKIDADRAVSSAKPIALCLKCEQMTFACKEAFDEFAESIELVVEDDETSDDEDASEDFFEDDGKFEDCDPDDDEDVVGIRAKYRSQNKERCDFGRPLILGDVDVALRLTNDFWRYIVKCRFDADEGFQTLNADVKLNYAAAAVFEGLKRINEIILQGELKDVISIVERCFSYRFTSHEPGFFLSTVSAMDVLKEVIKKTGDFSIPSFEQFSDGRIDVSIEDVDEALLHAMGVVYKYAFNAASVLFAQMANNNQAGGSANFIPQSMFDGILSDLNIAELSRITLSGCKYWRQFHHA